MRRAFAEVLVENAGKYSDIFVIAGDYESQLNVFKEKYPEKYMNIGTCEQSMINIAAGMAIEGFIPIIYTITPFLIERPFEQIKIAIDQQNLKVILIGYDDYPTQGPTHAAIDPGTIMQVFKNIKSFFPKDSNETKQAFIEAINRDGPSFIRLKRDNNL